MASINLLRVSAPGGHPQEVFQIKAIKGQPANLVCIALTEMIKIPK